MSAPTHPVLRTLVALHHEMKGGRAEVLVWRGADGTEAVVFGRRLFAATADGPVREASASVLARQPGGLAAMRRIVRRLLRLPVRSNPAPIPTPGDLNALATSEEVEATLDLVRQVTARDVARCESPQATDWEARFALDPPAVSTLRALLADLRFHEGPLDRTTDDAITHVREQLAQGGLRKTVSEAPGPTQPDEPPPASHRRRSP